ncbi:MAG: hypothetical protein Q8P18_00435 [Pseudomonadota bacterium]|nr:hypothetical protein [Pseudomonadota bacterium]
MTAPADLAEFRLVRALQTSQPGAFPTLWNAQAGAIWSVIRALCTTDTEAVGWATTFRVELAERASSLGTGDPVAAQVGLLLYSHLRVGFSGTAALPEPPVPPTEAGARQLPEAARLLYLVDLFFDVPSAALERVAGKQARGTLDAVHQLLEPPFSSEGGTDARLHVHAALMRPAPAAALILPPGAEPPPPRSRWWIWGVVGALILGFASTPWIRAWQDRPDLARLAALHRDALLEAPLRGSEPSELGQELTRREVPWQLAEVPDLSPFGLTLLGARIAPGSAAGAVLIYQGGASLWTLQHWLSAPTLDGPVVATLEAASGTLEARRAAAPSGADRAGGQGGPAPVKPDAVVVAWEEVGATWVLVADAPPDRVLDLAARFRESRAATPIPFLEQAPSEPVPGSEG